MAKYMSIFPYGIDCEIGYHKLFSCQIVWVKPQEYDARKTIRSRAQSWRAEGEKMGDNNGKKQKRGGKKKK